MQVYSAPDTIAKPAWPSPFNPDAYQAECNRYEKEILTWVRGLGYTGIHTGKIAGFGVADGTAQYMVADGGRKTILIHLDEVDGYDYMDVGFLPKKEILNRVFRKVA